MRMDFNKECEIAPSLPLNSTVPELLSLHSLRSKVGWWQGTEKNGRGQEFHLRPWRSQASDRQGNLQASGDKLYKFLCGFRRIIYHSFLTFYSDTSNAGIGCSSSLSWDCFFLLWAWQSPFWMSRNCSQRDYTAVTIHKTCPMHTVCSTTGVVQCHDPPDDSNPFLRVS